MKLDNVKINVPYYSQFLDIDDSFWMLRACGATALAMVVETLGASKQDILALCKEALDAGGYDMVNGWQHDYLVQKAKALGFTAHREEGLTDVQAIIHALEAGNPVIVSVEKRVLEQKRFHMVVLVGYEREDDSSVYTFYYHEPESTDRERGAYHMCEEKTFMEYWRGKAIFIKN